MKGFLIALLLAPFVAAPSNFKGTGTVNTVALVWTYSSNANGFYLEKQAAAGNYARIQTLPSSARGYTDQNLQASTKYNYRIQAYKGSGVSSYIYVSVVTADAPLPIPPAISNVAATLITTSGASISWTTDKASTSQVEYGVTTSYGSSTTLDPALVTSHNQVLTGLVPGTLYNYRVKSTDAGNLQGVSTNFTFSTAVIPPGPDCGTTAQVVTGSAIVTAHGPNGIEFPIWTPSTIKKVEFFVNDKSVYTWLVPDYVIAVASWAWDTPTYPNGCYTVKATATDAQGLTGSDSLPAQVKN